MSFKYAGENIFNDYCMLTIEYGFLEALVHIHLHIHVRQTGFENKVSTALSKLIIIITFVTNHLPLFCQNQRINNCYACLNLVYVNIVMVNFIVRNDSKVNC